MRAASKVTGHVRRTLPPAHAGRGGRAQGRAGAGGPGQPGRSDAAGRRCWAAPMHTGAVLVLGTGPGFSVEQARWVLGERIAAVPRLRQRLHRAPPGCGRPFWATTQRLTFGIMSGRCPVRRPATSGPWWRWRGRAGEPLPRVPAAVVRHVRHRPRRRGTGLVIVMNHVLADGIGGLAVLARLVDEAPARCPVTRRRWRSRARSPGRARSPPTPGRAGPVAAPTRRATGHDRQGLAELGGARPPRRRPPASLNRPTGPRRRLDVVTADLAAVRGLGHNHGGTVNDVILAAVTGALRALLASRGEQLDW